MIAPDVVLRAVSADDLPIFFTQQLDPDAVRMAAFPPRARDAFMAHWEKIMGMEGPVLRTILFEGAVAGNVVCWDAAGQPHIGYWIGKEYWGRGIATAALRLFLSEIPRRPLCARVTANNVASIRVLEKCGFKIARAETFVHDGKKMEEFILTLV